MKAKFRYVDLLVAGAVGSLIALVVHHQLRKAKAQKYIEQMGVNKPPVPDADIDEDNFGDAEAYDYEHFADVLKQMRTQEHNYEHMDNNAPTAENTDAPSGTNMVVELAKNNKEDAGPAAHEHTSAVEAEKVSPVTKEKESATTAVANETQSAESEGKSE